ncbi:MAG: hypothetical protein NVSMB1_22510 [Polyangiales bacterium]
MSPADGAGDYNKEPGEAPPTTGTESLPPPESANRASKKEADCPPRCGTDGAWSGCGLNKAHGSKCEGCTPKCKRKETADEGWYDCSGVLIVLARCS